MRAVRNVDFLKIFVHKNNRKQQTNQTRKEKNSTKLDI